jgi:sugar phosphate isomerase/epimerase
MDRRNFLRTASLSGAAMAATPMVAVRCTPADPMDRIGLTTVVFRNRFQSTCPKDVALREELSLSSIPEYFADRFGIHNVELWALHFESTNDTYLDDIKKALKKSQCRLIDIQAEGNYDVSDPDEENRQKGIDEMKEWIDICGKLNSRHIRISSMKMSYQKSVESLWVLSKYAKSKGVKILIENHNDMFSSTRHHLGIFDDVNRSNVGLLADFGNYREAVNRYAALKAIAPYTWLVSAKSQEFDADMTHTSYDYGKCVDIFEEAGYKGIYSLEQWGNLKRNYDSEKIVDWMINKTKEHITGPTDH